MTAIGTKIRKLRELRNLKQETMAELLGISQTAYSKIERDEIEVSQERLEQIAKALDVSVQDILSFDEKIFFNLIHNQDNASFGYIIHNNNVELSENERKLYEDKIHLMEEIIDNLKKEVERLKSKS